MHEGPTENRLGELGSLYKYHYYYYLLLLLLDDDIDENNKTFRMCRLC